MTKYLVYSLLAFMFCGILLAQESDSIRYPSFEFGGVLKAKYEWATNEDTSRFNIRNARVQVEGSILPKIDYKAKIELSNQGDFAILDIYGTYSPSNHLSFKFGQFSLPIFSGYTTDPGTMMFANRSFLAKYFVGTRDIGIMGIYNIHQLIIPAHIELGLFNGNSINNTEWSTKKSYAGRLTLGEMIGWQTTFKVYNNYRNTEVENEFQHYLIYGSDLRYGQENWKIETEVMMREDISNDVDLIAAYLQAAYAIPFKEERLIKHIIPAFRFDVMDQNKNEGNFDVSRLTFGLGLGLSPAPFNSILRIDYEWYFEQNELDFLIDSKDFTSDKLSLELVFIF